MNATKNTTATKEILGLIAGEGQLPVLLSQSAKERGMKVVALALSPEAAEQVEAHVDICHRVAPGQLGRNINLLEQEGVKQVVFIGKVPKINLLQNVFKLDWLAIKELSKLPNLNDDTIQVGIGNVMEQRGMRVLTQSEFLRHLFPSVGLMTKNAPSAEEYTDIEFGLKVAKEIARLDIGQTVVVRKKMIIAVEGIEGTDRCIQRAVELARGPVVVVKVAKLGQDQRFDIPTVGMNTMRSLKGIHPGGVLAVEAGETMVVEKEEMIEFAEKNGIAIVAVSTSESKPASNP